MGRFVSSDSVVYTRFCEIINGFTGYAMTRQDFESILERCGSPYAWSTVRAWLRGLERLGFVYPLYNIDQVRSCMDVLISGSKPASAAAMLESRIQRL